MCLLQQATTYTFPTTGTRGIFPGALEALAGRWLDDMHGPSTSGHTSGRAEKEQVDLGERIKMA